MLTCYVASGEILSLPEPQCPHLGDRGDGECPAQRDVAPGKHPGRSQGPVDHVPSAAPWAWPVPEGTVALCPLSSEPIQAGGEGINLLLSQPMASASVLCPKEDGLSRAWVPPEMLASRWSTRAYLLVSVSMPW